MGVPVLFSFVAFILGSLLIIILLNRHKEISYRFLAFFLFTLTYYSFTVFLFESKYLLYTPFLLRIGPLLSCFTAPALCFYILFTLNFRWKLKWKDLIHFIPAVTFFIDYFPFFISSNAYKLKIIKSFYGNIELVMSFNEGWLIPHGMHYILKDGIALGYVCYLGVLLYRYRYNSKGAKIDPQLLNWLRFTVILFAVFTITALTSFFFSSLVRYAVMATLWQPLVMFSVLGIILLFNPDILYGSYIKGIPALHTEETRRLVIDKALSLQVKDSLGEFIGRKDYLRQNIRIKEVGEELGIQPYLLSAYINQLYQIRFNDYINQHRIEYIKDGLITGEWSQLTLEAIAEKGGFSNRTTFLNAFKKFTGVTPTAFMQENKKHPIINVVAC